MLIVEVALEAVGDIDDIAEAGGDQRLTGRERAVSAAADQHHRSFATVPREPSDFAHEVRVDLPVGAVVPRHMDRARRVTDEEVFDLAAHIDQQGLGVGLQVGVRLLRGEVFHPDLL